VCMLVCMYVSIYVCMYVSMYVCGSISLYVSGTNLQALIEQAKHPCSSAEIVVVISNRPGVQGLKRTSLAGIQTRVKINTQHVC
ncbi:Trifunctional purine biosynthetic protein adenosine-3, partial [Nibea albiflora]